MYILFDLNEIQLPDLPDGKSVLSTIRPLCYMGEGEKCDPKCDRISVQVA